MRSIINNLHSSISGVTAPTGISKISTLYAMLCQFNTESTNIFSIETMETIETIETRAEPEPLKYASNSIKKIKLLFLLTDVGLSSSLSSVFDQDSDSVIFASNSLEVLRVAFIERPDLIIADVQLTEDKGKKLFGELKSYLQTWWIPILAILPNKESLLNLSDEMYELKVDDYLIKPIEPKELLNKINSLLPQLF